MKTRPLRLFAAVQISALLFVFAPASHAAPIKDGITVPKLELQRQRELDKYDTNHDGRIDGFERAAMIRDKQQEKKDEKAEREADLLKKYDLNHDGKLDAKERAAMKADLEKEGVEPKKKAAADKKEKAREKTAP